MNPPVAIETKTRTIQGNEPLFLTDPKVLWRVHSGAVAVFSVPLHQGQPVGDRRYLFTVQPGEALFSAALPEGTGLGLMAIAVEPAGVSSTPLEEVESDQLPLPVLKTLSDSWIKHLSEVEGVFNVPKGTMAPDIHYISLTKGQRCHASADQVLWVRMQQGSADWMGQSAFPITPESGCFPITEGTFLEAQDHIEFFARDTSQVKNRIIIVRGLKLLHRYFLETLTEQDAVRQRRDLKRFQQRQELNQTVTQKVIRTLAGVLETQERYDDESPLLTAAGAVGKALGVTIEPPAHSENPDRVKEPLEAIARASQLRLRRVLLRGQWWHQDGGPLVAYTREDHQPVALLPVGTKGYELLNPAGLAAGKSSQPQRVTVTPKVAQTIAPVAFMFYRPLPMGQLSAWTLFQFAFRGQGRDWLAILLTGVAATLMGMLVPQATAALVDTIIPYGDVALLVQVGLGLLAASLGVASFQLAQAIASLRVETASDAALQAAVWDRLLKLRTAFFRQYAIGDLNSRVSSINTIRRKLSGTALQGIFTGLFSLLNLGLLIYYSPSLALISLLVAVVVMVVTLSSGLILLRKYRPLLEIQGKLYGLVVQLINGVSKLRIAGAEERAFAAWGQRYGEQLRITLSTQQLEDGVSVFNTVLPVFTTLILFWLASHLVGVFGGTGLSTGSFLAFSVAYGTFIAGATSLSNTLVSLLDVVPLWQRAQPILHAEPEVDPNKADPGQLSGALSVDRVDFRYREDTPLILNTVSVHAEAGEFIALVGPSGSGKSTVMRLLLGFETPQAGSVYYDGQDMASLDVVAIRRQLGVVLQTSRLGAGSVFENIAGGALISLDDAWAAAEMAGFADDLRSMPMQLHTVVSEGGGNLSGGQRQRLLIARALAMKPKIMLMDEATSALDNRTQKIVTQSLDQLNVTRVVIAHRLSTIRNADRIYVLEAGAVKQQGSFDELAVEPGLFQQLIRRQMA